MKRYTLCTDTEDDCEPFTSLEPDQEGEWVRYGEAQGVIDQLQADLRVMTADRDGFARIAERRRTERDLLAKTLAEWPP